MFPLARPRRSALSSATWTVGFTTSASGALAIGGTITINAPASTTFPSAASAYKVNGTTVTATPTTAAGTVTIATPVAVGNSSAISVVITGVTNPAVGTYANTSFSVSTSADTAASNPASGQAFSVGSASTTTGLALSSASVAYDSETSEIFTVTVTGQTGDGHPEGTVAVYNSATELCSATLSPVGGHSASATCSLTAHELAAGSYGDVFATYSPGTPSSSNAGYTYGTSSSTPVQAFSVGSASTTTGLALSSASVAYGSETSEIFTVTVTGQTGDGHPEGTVAVYNSSTKLCGATLTPIGGHSASATCSLTAHELAAGSYSDVFATYSPGTPSSSNASYTYGTSSSTPVQAFSVALGDHHDLNDDESRAVCEEGHLRRRAGRAALGQRLAAAPGHHANWDRHDQWRELSDHAVGRQGLVHAAACLLQRRQPQHGRHLSRQLGLQALGFGEKDRHHRHGHDDDKPRAVRGTSHLRT